MEVDDIISYQDVVTAERAALQKGMNYGVGKNYSVFLMWLRENALYAYVPRSGHRPARQRGTISIHENLPI
jgi:hypothetical protein